jgi:hypothetical protein
MGTFGRIIEGNSSLLKFESSEYMSIVDPISEMV